MIISYDGKNYFGWQVQPNRITIQKVIEDALKKIYNQNIDLVGSGRTDSGVHADYQVAHFEIEKSFLPIEKLHSILNRELPADIKILSATKAGDDFHARFSAKKRVYRYYFYTGDIIMPRYRDYFYHIRKNVDLKKLNRLASIFIGKYDFSGFCSSRDASSSKVRIVEKSKFFKISNLQGCYYYEICANSFLWNMVRSIVGTIFDYESLDNSEEIIKDILLNQNRKKVGKTAPAKGLVLYKVMYNGKI